MFTWDCERDKIQAPLRAVKSRDLVTLIDTVFNFTPNSSFVSLFLFNTVRTSISLGAGL